MKIGITIFAKTLTARPLVCFLLVDQVSTCINQIMYVLWLHSISFHLFSYDFSIIK